MFDKKEIFHPLIFSLNLWIEEMIRTVHTFEWKVLNKSSRLIAYESFLMKSIFLKKKK